MNYDVEMSTIFDVVTVTCFFAVAMTYFQFTDRNPKELGHFILAGILFAFANQLGNNGQGGVAWALIVLGAGYIVVRLRYQW